MSISLTLSKPSDAPKLKLNLKKSPSYLARLQWDCKTDLDLHALVATNIGGVAKISAHEDILSTYNVRRMVNGSLEGHIVPNADKTFSVHGGALTHSPDATDGQVHEGDDEWIRVKPELLNVPAGTAIEIPLIAMIHKAGNKTFRDVVGARVVVEDADGEELLVMNLTAEFAGTAGVQMGSIIIDKDGANFMPVGGGFSGDFNTVLEQFL